jgi:hypothetical protein
MRAADSDRQFVADRLREALDEGRLDLGEYDDRLREAYAARTYGELDKLLDDLPAVVPPAKAQVARATGPVGTPAPAAAPAQTPGRMPPWLWAIWGSWITATLVCGVIWLLTGAGYPWPLWVAGPWGALLLARTIGAIASGDPASHAAAEQARERERQDRHRRRDQERWERRRERREGRE